MAGIVVCRTESIQAIYRGMWRIDFLLSITTILHLSTSSTTSWSEFKQMGEATICPDMMKRQVPQRADIFFLCSSKSESHQ